MFFREKPAASIKPATNVCSFCGKSHVEVRELIVGGGGNICGKCIMICKGLHEKKLATYTCSFCGKSHDEVRKLISGPGVNICDKCVVVCKELLEKQSEGQEVALANAEAIK